MAHCFRSVVHMLRSVRYFYRFCLALKLDSMAIVVIVIQAFLFSTFTTFSWRKVYALEKSSVAKWCACLRTCHFLSLIWFFPFFSCIRISMSSIKDDCIAHFPLIGAHQWQMCLHRFIILLLCARVWWLSPPLLLRSFFCCEFRGTHGFSYLIPSKRKRLIDTIWLNHVSMTVSPSAFCHNNIHQHIEKFVVSTIAHVTRCACLLYDNNSGMWKQGTCRSATVATVGI